MIRNLAILLIFAMTPHACYANSFTDKLNHVVSQITSTKKELHHKEKQHKKIQNRLRKYDVEIGDLSKTIAKTQNELNENRSYLRHLNKRQKDLEKSVNANQKQLKYQLRSIYMSGNKNSIKMVLNQQNPNDFDRMLIYHKAISKNRFEVIGAINVSLAEIKENRKIIQKKTNLLNALQKKLIAQEKNIQLNRHRRRTLLRNLASVIHTHRQKLAALDASKKQLEITINKLKTDEKDRVKYFTNHKHKLPWPTKGDVSVAFGTQIQQSHLKWNGILINAKEGNPVRAIAPGKVVFSNWMPGFGLLLILDHGDGYMSLYGRNNSLFKSTGDEVKAGDLLASVGMSGGHSKPALYFSLRHNGKPMDPTEWCTTTGLNA